MTGVSALNDRFLSRSMLVLALKYFVLGFLLSSFLSLLQSFLLFIRALISSMPFQSGTQPSSIAAYTTVDTDGSLCVIPLPLPWILLFQLSRFWTIAQTWMIAGTTVVIVVGRFVLIRAELGRVDRIQRWEGRYIPSFSELQVDQKDCKEEIGKAAWVWAVDHEFCPHHCDNPGTGEHRDWLRKCRKKWTGIELAFQNQHHHVAQKEGTQTRTGQPARTREGL